MARRSFLRRRESIPNLVASAQEIDISKEDIVKALLKRQEKWQSRAFDILDTVGEIKFGVYENASLMSRLVLFAAELPEDQDAKPTRTSNDKVIQAVEDLGDFVERADIQRELAVQLQVPGECFLVGIQPGADRKNEEFYYEIASIEEIEEHTLIVGNEKVSTVKLKEWNDDGSDLILNPRGSDPDTFIRIWRRSARKAQKADSHVKSVIQPAEELLWWDSVASATAKNRLAMSGMVGIPDNIKLKAETGDENPNLEGSQRFINKILQAMMTAIANPAAAEAAVPILYTYPANEQGKSGIDKTEMDRPQDDLLEQRTDRCLLRIAQGLNLPVEVITGMGSATHWGAGQIEEGQFKKHVEPLAVLLVNALTQAYLHPVLRSQGVDPDRYVIWYDASSLVVNQNLTRDTIRAVELGGASWSALRRVIGLTEADAPTDEERQQILEWLSSVRRGTGQQGIIEDPDKSPEEDMRDPNSPPEEQTPGERTPVEQPAAPLRRRGQKVAASIADHVINGHSNGEALLRAQLQVYADEKVRRALEKAGNRLLSRARKVPSYAAAVKGQPQTLVASTLGREACLKLGIDTVFDGCFEGIHSRLVYLAQSHFPPSTDYTVASASLTNTLREIATERLFKPPSEEFVVPSSVIEETLAKLPVPA